MAAQESGRHHEDGPIYERGPDQNTFFRVNSLAGTEAMRRMVWDKYPKDDRQTALAGLDLAFKRVRIFALKGGVLTKDGDLYRIGAIDEQMQIDLEAERLLAFQAKELKGRCDAPFMRQGKYHFRRIVLFAAPELIKGIYLKSNDHMAALGLDINGKSVVQIANVQLGLAAHVMSVMRDNLPPKVRPPYTGDAVVFNHLHDLSQQYKQSAGK